MRRTVPTLFLALAAALPARAQQSAQDYELAGLLAARGWFDLAREIYEKMERNPQFSKAQQAEGSYGLAWLVSLQVDHEPKPEKRLELFNTASETILKFINAPEFANHPRRADALGVIGDLLQKKGKFLLGQGRHLDPDGAQAQGAFTEAQKLFKSLIEQLDREKIPAPDTGTAENDPKYIAWLDWNQKMMTAKYNFGISLFNEAEAYKNSPAKHPQMQKLFEQMNDFFEKQFMWDYEQYLLAYAAFTYMGRGYQMLAETSGGAKAEESWKKCFNFIEKAARLIDDPEMRKSEGVRELALESAVFAVKARLAYGDTLRSGKAAREYQNAAKFAGERLKLLPPTTLKEWSGLQLRLEEGRALCKAGQMKDGIERLDRIKRDAANDPKLGWAENYAIDLLGEFAGETDMRRAIEAGDNLIERGPAYLSRAIQKYRNAIHAARKAEDRKLIPYCWLKIGECYYYMDRWIEAAGAFSMVLDNPEFNRSADAPKIALTMKRTLARLIKATGAPEDKERMKRFLDSANTMYPEALGESGIQEDAISKEEDARKVGPKDKYANQYLLAAETWLKLANKTGSALREEATFRAAYNLFLHAYRVARTPNATKDDQAKAKDAFEKCIEYARKHIQLVDGLPSRESGVVRNVTGSVIYGMWACLQESVARPADALALSENFATKYPSADKSLMMKVLQRRVEAHLDLAKLNDAKPELDHLQKADAELNGMEQRYEQDPLGLDGLQNARASVSSAYSALSARLGATDPALSESMKIRGAEIMFRYIASSTADPKPEELEARADTFFDIATRKMEKAQAKGDAVAIKEAREMFEKAQQLYERLILSSGANLSDDQMKAIQSRQVTCLLKAGKFDKVLAELSALEGSDPEMRRGSDWEALGDCKMEKANSMAPGSPRNELIGQAAGIYYKLFLRLGEKNGTHYWRMIWKYCDALFQIDPDQLDQFFSSMLKRAIAPKWDDGQFGFQSKIEDLRAKNDARLPNKKKEENK